MSFVEIRDSDALYRRVVSFHVKPDGSISSAAFKDRRKRPEASISVDLARLSTPEETRDRDGRSGFGVIALSAGTVREMGFIIRHAPVTLGDPVLPPNPAHCLIEGENTNERCAQLAAGSRLILPPGDRP